MIGTRQLARVLEVAEKAHAKVVLVGDPEQLQAIEAGAPFRGIAAQHWRGRAHAGAAAAAGVAAGGDGGVAVGQDARRRSRATRSRRAIVAVEDAGAGAERTPRALGAGCEGGAQGLAARARVHAGRCAGAQCRRADLASSSGRIRARAEEIATEQGKKEFAVHDRITSGGTRRPSGSKTARWAPSSGSAECCR